MSGYHFAAEEETQAQRIKSLEAEVQRLKLEVEEHAAVDYYSSRYKAAEKMIVELKDENYQLRRRVESLEGIEVKHGPLQALPKAN